MSYGVTVPDLPGCFSAGAQMYVAGWETRNLRMVANIRATFREQPGARVLSIVGASHKLWFDSLLSQMQGVDVVDTESLYGGVLASPVGVASPGPDDTVPIISR